MLSPIVERVGRRLTTSSDETEELRQRLRVLLLVSEPGERPRILQYGGRGSLHGWLKTTAMRHGLNMRQRGRRHEPLEAQAAEALAMSLPQLQHADREQRVVFVDQLRDAFFELDTRERTLLRLHLVDGLSLAALSRAYNVHRTTASRWVSAACDQLSASLLRRMNSLEASGLQRDIVSAVRSQLEVSLRDILASSVAD